VGGGRRPLSPLGALAVLVVLLASGCATAPERRPPVLGGVTAGEADALVRRWEAQWGEFRGLRGAVDLTVVRRGQAQRSAGAVLLSPTQLRFEAISPLGLPALIVTVGPDRLLVVSPGEGKAWTARPTPEALARWIGVPVPPDTLIRLLAGTVPPPAAGAAIRVEHDRGPHLAFLNGTATERVWVTAEGLPARLELGDGQRLTVTFERTVDGPVQSLVIEAPAQSLEVHLRYISGDYLVVPADAFEIPIPPAMPIEHLD
jgi:hypothetical protein